MLEKSQLCMCVVVSLGVVLCLAACGERSEQQAQRTAACDPDMVFVPSGEFQMGADGPDAFPDEQPVHTVSVSAFYIDCYEVTNAEYRCFVLETGHAPPRLDASWAVPYNWTGTEYPAGTADHPVVLVSWHDAAAYATWAGKRLPTEAEWEKAARAGITGQNFPHGQRLELNDANYFKSYLRSRKLRPVGRFKPNNLGLHDMAGNVWEWCQDWYSSDYYRDGAVFDPQGPPNGDYKVFRGGSWMSDAPFLRCAQRGKNSPDYKSHRVGFRCVRSCAQSAIGGVFGG